MGFVKGFIIGVILWVLLIIGLNAIATGSLVESSILKNIIVPGFIFYPNASQGNCFPFVCQDAIIAIGISGLIYGILGGILFGGKR